MKKAASLHIILRGTNRNCLQEFDCFVRSRLTVAQAYGLFQTPDTSYHHEEDVGWMAPLEEPGPGCSSPGTDRRHQVDIGTVLRGTDWLRSQYPAPCPISSPGGQGQPGVSSPGGTDTSQRVGRPLHCVLSRLYSAVQSNDVLFSAVLFSTVKCNARQYRTIQCNAVNFNINT